MTTEDKITREKIIHAVLYITFTRSVDGTSLADIADNLGIQKASLYNHFPNRTAIINATTQWCCEFLHSISFATEQTFPDTKTCIVEDILKDIVYRWFKLNETEPLFQIYSFLHSEKYYSTEAARIILDCRRKIINQTTDTLLFLSAAQKITHVDHEAAEGNAIWFCGTIRDLLDTYLVDKKAKLRALPDIQSNSLFTLPPDDIVAYQEFELFIRQFCLFLNAK
jgi:AcrR family transcriptional regulator